MEVRRDQAEAETIVEEPSAPLPEAVPEEPTTDALDEPDLADLPEATVPDLTEVEEEAPAAALEESLRLLNKYDNIGEARGLLINLAGQYDWTDKERVEIARDFIKLVRRRYV